MTESQTTNSLGPHPDSAALAAAVLEAERALLERPSISLRSRVGAVFALLFLLVCGFTVMATVLALRISSKQQFLERAQNYAFEIQQARRFEKNFFLYRTNLSDALSNIHTARSYLERADEEILPVIGRPAYDSMVQNLTGYVRSLEELYATSKDGPSPTDSEPARIETRIRTYGAQIVADAQQMIDQERAEMHATAQTSIVVAVGFLVFLLFAMASVAWLILRSVLVPLVRFERYAARIGAGDYSPIMPVRKYRDEFSRLALAINQMLRELTGRQEQFLQSGKMAAVGTLTSGIAHELNNPLNNIGITIEALIDGYGEHADEQKLNMLKQAYTQVERASGTVRNLLDFTRKDRAVATSVAIRDVLETTARLVSNELTLGGVELNLDVGDGIPTISGNPRDLEQVFLNLFLNSIQAMPEGGSLGVHVTADQEFVRVDVTDTGIGIPPENLSQIFDLFYTTKEPGRGTGLGLAVSHGIVDKHGGRIAVESTVGEGTTFSVYLPAKPLRPERQPARRE